jgi:hypothetical protein
MKAVSVLASASGTRIDCDDCGEHSASPYLTVDQLRRATGYVRIAGRDYCPRCARSLRSAGALINPAGRRTRSGASPRSS